MIGGWTSLDQLRPGTIFETRDGARYVLQETRNPAGHPYCVFLGDGSITHFNDDQMPVRPVPMPPMAPPEAEADQAVHAWFELSYAQYLTVPRSVLEAMPGPWQERFAACLHELDATFDWRPREGSYWVRLKDDNGRYAEDPLMQYRHPNYSHIESLRKRT